MNPSRVAEIRARMKAATPGPWDCGVSLDGRRCSVINHNRPGEEVKVIVEYGPNDLSGIRKPEKIANTKFIAHAPQDIADLLAERDALVKAHDEMVDVAKALQVLLAQAEPELTNLTEENARLKKYLSEPGEGNRYRLMLVDYEKLEAELREVKRKYDEANIWQLTKQAAGLREGIEKYLDDIDGTEHCGCGADVQVGEGYGSATCALHDALEKWIGCDNRAIGK